MLGIVRLCANLLLPTACYYPLARAGQDMINGVKLLDTKLLARFVRKGMAAHWTACHCVRLKEKHWPWAESIMSLRSIAVSLGTDYEKIVLLRWLLDGVPSNRRTRLWKPGHANDSPARHV